MINQIFEKLDGRIKKIEDQINELYRVGNASGKWTDYSGISTIVGWSSFIGKYIYYKLAFRTVFVQFYIVGTSDSTLATFTLPYALRTTGGPPYISALIRARDNSGTTIAGVASMQAGDNVVTCYSTPALGAWTAANQKIVFGQLFYEPD